MSPFRCAGQVAIDGKFEKCSLDPTQIVANQAWCAEHAPEVRLRIMRKTLWSLGKNENPDVRMLAQQALRDCGMDEAEGFSCVIRKETNHDAYQRLIGRHLANLRDAPAKPAAAPQAAPAPTRVYGTFLPSRTHDADIAGHVLSPDEDAFPVLSLPDSDDPSSTVDPAAAADKPVIEQAKELSEVKPDPNPEPATVVVDPKPQPPPTPAQAAPAVKPAAAHRPAPPNVGRVQLGQMPLVQAVWTPERNEIIRRDWPKGVPTEQIFDACRRLPGSLIKHISRIGIQAAALGVKRPPKDGNSALPLWSERRKSLLAEEFPAGKTLDALKRGLESMPGPRVSNPQIIEQAKAMGLRRPDWFEKRNAPDPQPDVPHDAKPVSKPSGCAYAFNDAPPYKFCNAPVTKHGLYCSKHQLEMKQQDRAKPSSTSAAPAPGGTTKGPRALRDYGAFSRFTHISPSANEAGASLPRLHPAVLEARTLFPSRVRDVNHPDKKRLLVSGYNSPKTGSIVTKGPWAGMPIYTLTLEERATCPRSCIQWRSCMGNGMHFPLRTSPSPALIPALRRELIGLALEHPQGFVVRLHILGDFFSVDYARFWVSMLDECPQLHVFGYSAQPQYNAIAAVLNEGNEDHSDRWAIRFSGPDTVPAYMATTVIWRHPEKAVVPEGIVCPAQTERTACCGTCALCWNPAAAGKRIVFIGHGGHPKAEPKDTEARKAMDIAA